jgi:ribA/ribD-fused uncharacterized protein
MITKFQGRWHFLSNFYPCIIEHKGIKYPSVEHYYVAMKVTEIQMFDGIHYTAGDFRELIAKVKLPSDVKKIGQRVKIRKDWDEKKLQFMEWGVREKFKDPKIAELMLLTGNDDIIEGNYWHDNFWGSCICQKCGNNGENHLGKILMNIRDEIKQQNIKPSLEQEIKNKLK